MEESTATKKMHVLVYNLEKTAPCPPIPLKEIQDMFERNGVIAGLQKWDICMVPFGVEGKMHQALIVELSENPEELQREYHTMMEKKDLRQPQQAVNRTMHVLVYNLEKTALCPPIPLKEIQDTFERNGVIAGLQKWDICMVPFGVEGKMHRALIVELSDNLKDLQSKYDTVTEKKALRQAQETVNGPGLMFYTLMIGGGILATSFVVAAAPLALSAATLSADGIVRAPLPSRMIPPETFENGGRKMVISAGEYIVGDLISDGFIDTTKSASSAGIGLAHNMISFAAETISHL